ncbi:hypothetical protein [Segatella maculosa]|uniref:hypothetical protein n=1 Tax=Segatella maculosa TaxID=439703 RepID=UPI000364D60F|nr:hypothetical protein [Segatella maculosa]
MKLAIDKPHRGFIVYRAGAEWSMRFAIDKPHRGFVIYRAGLPNKVRQPYLGGKRESNAKRCEAHPFPPKGKENVPANRLDSPPFEGSGEA